MTLAVIIVRCGFALMCFAVSGEDRRLEQATKRIHKR